MRNSPRSPTVKTNGSSREGNRIINPHSRIPKSTNKQTNKQTGAYWAGRFGLIPLLRAFGPDALVRCEMPRDLRHVQDPLGRASTARAWDMANPLRLARTVSYKLKLYIVIITP